MRLSVDSYRCLEKSFEKNPFCRFAIDVTAATREGDPTGDAAPDRGFEQLVDGRADLVYGSDPREERHRLALEEAEGRGDVGLPEGLLDEVLASA